MSEQKTSSLEVTPSMYDLQRSLGYLKLLVGDIEKFETLTASNSPPEEVRESFMHLMTLTLGSTTDWKRMRTLAGKLGLGLGTLERYVRRVTAPHPFVYPVVCKCLKEMLESESEVIQATLEPLEAAAEEKRLAEQKEWQDLSDRIYNPLPGTSLNCQVSYRSNNKGGDLQTDLLFSYPCLGIYYLSRMFVSICSECNKNGKDQAHTHGRVILSCEDGLMLLPQIVRTQADLMQVIEDLRVDKDTGGSLILDHESWFEECIRVLSDSSVVQSLAEGNPDESKPRDLSKDKLCWVM